MPGGAFSRVIIYKDYVIKEYKNIKVRNIKREDSFKKEIKALKLLKGEQYFPQLLDYDEKKFTIKMSYCGKSLDSKEYKEVIFNYENYEENFKSIFNSLNENKIQHHDIDRWNMCFDGNSFYLIDFNLVVFNDLTNPTYFFNSLKNRILVKKWDAKNRKYY